MINEVNKSEFAPFAEWHKGRKRYAVWMYRFENSELNNLINELQGELRSIINFHPFNKPHLTVAPAGFPCNTKQLDDDITFSEIAEIAKSLKKLKLQRPCIRLKNLETFHHCPYIECEDISATTELLNKKLIL